MKYISLEAVIMAIEKRMSENEKKKSLPQFFGMVEEDLNILSILDTLEVKEIGVDLGDPKGDKSAKYIIDTKNLEVKEVANTPNIRFPHYKSIVEKVFGAGNLESFEYDEAERLVSLAKEELLKDLEVKEVDLEHLEQEVKDFCYKFDERKDKWYDMTPHDQNLMVSPTFANFAMQLAKHFFELGMAVSNKVQKED